nr:MAG TPA: hypothetical protein [Caudoviricetes sp.]
MQETSLILAYIFKNPLYKKITKIFSIYYLSRPSNSKS